MQRLSAKKLLIKKLEEDIERSIAELGDDYENEKSLDAITIKAMHLIDAKEEVARCTSSMRTLKFYPESCLAPSSFFAEGDENSRGCFVCAGLFDVQYYVHEGEKGPNLFCGKDCISRFVNEKGEIDNTNYHCHIYQ